MKLYFSKTFWTAPLNVLVLGACGSDSTRYSDEQLVEFADAISETAQEIPEGKVIFVIAPLNGSNRVQLTVTIGGIESAWTVVDTSGVPRNAVQIFESEDQPQSQ